MLVAQFKISLDGPPPISIAFDLGLADVDDLGEKLATFGVGGMHHPEQLAIAAGF